MSALTDERIDNIWIFRVEIHDGDLTKQLRDFARNIEREVLAAHPGQQEPRAEVTLTADHADMVWLADDGETFFHSIDDAVDCAVDQEWPSVEPLELKLSLGKRIPTATVRVFNITENGHEWEIVDAARTGAALDCSPP